MAEHIKATEVNTVISMAFTTSATPNAKTTVLEAGSRSGFRINAPLATDDIFVYYVDYPDGETTPLYKISAGGNSVSDNYIDRSGVARSYMGEVQVSSPSASQSISVVEYLPSS